MVRPAGDPVRSAPGRPVPDLAKVIARLRTSLPVMKVVKLDEDVRKLLITEMVAMHLKDGLALVLPETQVVHRVSDDEFRRYRDLLSGINDDNAAQVRQQLAELGAVGPPTGSAEESAPLPARATRPADPSTDLEAPEAKRARHNMAAQQGLLQQLVGTLSKTVAALAQVIVPDEVPRVVAHTAGLRLPVCGLGPLPPWAAHCRDKRRTLSWDSEQYVATVVINGVAVLAIVDTGSWTTLFDKVMARTVNLKTRQATEQDGYYMTPGAEQARPYTCVLDGAVTVQLAEGIGFDTDMACIVEHPVPLLLLGADVLKGGRVGGWNFAGIRVVTDEDGVVSGTLEFTQGSRREHGEPLLHCPRHASERFSSKMVAHMGAAGSAQLLGGEPDLAPQLVRPGFG